MGPVSLCLLSFKFRRSFANQAWNQMRNMYLALPRVSPRTNSDPFITMSTRFLELRSKLSTFPLN